ncbi:MAG: hypothetical protein AB1568_11145 [Thermodesulfobacteriota bacterium]
MKASLPSALPPTPFGPGSHGAVSQFAGVERKSASFSITTREGDTVTVSAAGSWAGQLTVAGDSFTSLQMQANSLQVSVHGELNARELEDISELVDSLTGIGRAFFDGDMGTALDKAARLGLGDSLSMVAADFHHSATHRLSQNHPLPAQWPQGDFPEGVNPHRQRAGEKGTNLDRLLANWQQITEHLERHGGAERERPETDIATFTELLAALQNRVEAYLGEHPRLTPFMPALAERAINQAGVGHPAATATASRVAAAMNQWLLAV